VRQCNEVAIKLGIIVQLGPRERTKFKFGQKLNNKVAFDASHQKLLR
jgi:hypothetical protein